MIEVPQGERLVSFHAVVKRADGRVENLGLIDHSHAWLFSEHALRTLCHAEEHFENLLDLSRRHEPGAVIIPAGSASIEGGKGVFAGQVGGLTAVPPQYIGFGQGDPAGTRVTALTTDLGLTGEITVNSGQTQRVAGTVTTPTTTTLADTLQVVGTITAGASLSIVEAALFTTQPWPAQTTIATVGALSGTGTGTTTLTSGAGLPTAATNYEIDQEILTGTLSGTTLTITARGANGSTAVAHSAGAFITVVSPTGTGAGGLCAAKGDFAVISLAAADSLQLTAKVQFT